jgi:hypothetical protein
MRTSIFFFCVAVVCGLILPVMPSELRYVNYGCIAVALWWAILFQVEYRLARRRGERPENFLTADADEPEVPFAPPPPPRD